MGRWVDGVGIGTDVTSPPPPALFFGQRDMALITHSDLTHVSSLSFLSRFNIRVCSAAASVSPARACAPLSPT